MVDNKPSEVPINPFEPPRIDEAHKDEASSANPTVGAVTLLLALQIGCAAVASAAALSAVRRPMILLSLSAIALGAALFAVLRARQGGAWSVRARRRLALWGMLTWASMSAMVLGLVKYVFAPGVQLSAYRLLLGLGFACSYYLFATLLGLWAGSRLAGRRD
jgi:FtsH-binding integral membrane protein